MQFFAGEGDDEVIAGGDGGGGIDRHGVGQGPGGGVFGVVECCGGGRERKVRRLRDNEIYALKKVKIAELTEKE